MFSVLKNPLNLTEIDEIKKTLQIKPERFKTPYVHISGKVYKDDLRSVEHKYIHVCRHRHRLLCCDKK